MQHHISLQQRFPFTVSLLSLYVLWESVILSNTVTIASKSCF